MTSNKEFFDAVIRPCVANAIGGQSYTFLVCGPPQSGRSQTLYGAAAGREPGILELTATELLALGGKKTTTAAATSSALRPSGDDIAVTYSTFVAMGHSLIDAATNAEAHVKEFPPPLGTIAMPSMALLTDPLAVASQPKLKVAYSHASSFTQFHVYRSLNTEQDLKPAAAAANSSSNSYSSAATSSSSSSGGAKYAMSVLTFIDVAAFSAPTLPPDLQCLTNLVTNLVSGGSDVNFRQCRLTQLLEQSLVGPATLVGIGNISAKPELQQPAGAMLRFLMSLLRMNQVLMLLQLQVPRWVTETSAAMDVLCRQQQLVVQRSYERGVSDFFAAASSVASRMCDANEMFLECVRSAEDVRADVRRQVTDRVRELQGTIAHSAAEIESAATITKALREQTDRGNQELQVVEERIAKMQQDIAQCDFNADHRVTELRLHVDDLANATAGRRGELDGHKQDCQDHLASAAEYEQSARKFLGDLEFVQRHHSLAHEINELAAKKRRLEEDLELASRAAHTTNEAHRLERQRRSKMARVTLLEAKVNTIIEVSKASSTAVVASSAAGAGGGSIFARHQPNATGKTQKHAHHHHAGINNNNSSFNSISGGSGSLVGGPAMGMDMDGPPVVLRASPLRKAAGGGGHSAAAAAASSSSVSLLLGGGGGWVASSEVASPAPRHGSAVETTLF
jgi:hypothetical protein